MANCTYIDGIGSSQAIDTAGEIVDLKGLDCSSLLGAAFNWEHKSDVPAQLVGKVLDYKKIFSEKDCDNERHTYFWNRIKIPFLYVMGRLMDDKNESAKHVAGLFLDDAEHPDEMAVVGFSIEGAKIHKEGMTITRSIARKVTITNLPANKTCVGEMLPKPEKDSEDDIMSIFKTEPVEVEFFKPSSKYLEFLEKREKDMNKDDALAGGSLAVSEMEKAQVPGSKYPPKAQVSPTSVKDTAGPPKFGPMPTKMAGPAAAPPAPVVKTEEMNKSVAWSGGKQKGDAVHFSHPEHGTVSIHKHPSGEYHVKHNGAMAGIGGVKGSFQTPGAAGAHAKKYMGAVGSGAHSPKKMHNMVSGSMPAGMGKSEPMYHIHHKGTRISQHPMTIHQLVQHHGKTPKEMEKNPDIKLVPHKEPAAPKMQKAMTAGSGMAAPSQLEGGAALAKEGKIGTLSPASQAPSDKPKKFSMTSIKVGVGGGSSVGFSGAMGKKEKSSMLQRAEEAYAKWEKREEFVNFMKKNMPHLAKGEVDAIGQTIALKKSLEAEGKLSKMLGSFYGKGEKKE